MNICTYTIHTAVLFFFFYFTGDTVKTRLSKQEMKVQSARITEKDIKAIYTYNL